MDSEALDALTHMSSSIVRDDWKKSLQAIFDILRKKFVFDNLAIYLDEGDGSTPEVVYARAAGRGRNKEAEASWGDEIANQVISTGNATVSIPADQQSEDRIAMPFFLGMPLILLDRRGALVFVRFGGPEYTNEQMPLAALSVVQTARV